MLCSFKLLVTLLVLLTLTRAERVGSVTFTPPPGWSVKIEGPAATLTPPGGAAGGLMLILPDQQVTGNAGAWFAATVEQLSGDGQITDQTDTTTAQTASGGSLLMRGVSVRLAQGVQNRFYAARVSGGAATLYVLVAPSTAALKKWQPDYVALINAGPAPAASATAAGGSLLGQKSALPDIKPQNAAQFVAAGGDPKAQIIPDEFRCYQEKKGNSLTPELAVQVLPGGQYRTPYGSGTVTAKKDSSLVKLDWKGGPLDRADGYLSFDHYGQHISLSHVGEDVLEDDLSFECYQRGPRENLALLEFKLKTPAIAKYPCAPKDASNKSVGTLEILAGGQYRLNGQMGHYTYDFRGDQDQDWSDLKFMGGALDDAIGNYSESKAGVREVSIYRPGLICKTVVKPTPIARYGAATAPAAPKGSGGLSGAYVHWYADPLVTMGLSSCGGLCWDVLIFDKSGYVFTDEPETSIDEANCTRTHPNGLPICEVYTVQGSNITIGKDKLVTFKKLGNALEIDGDPFQPMLKLEAVKLGGQYESKSFVGGGVGSTVSGAFQNTLTFTPQGKFSQERSGGVSSTFTDTGTASGTVTGGFTSTNRSASSGMYSVKGYTLTLTYGDGHKEQMFAFALPDTNGKPKLDLLRLGGSSYTVRGKSP